MKFVCPICLSRQTSEFTMSENIHGARLIANKRKFIYQRCNNCESLFLKNFRIPKNFFKIFYGKDYLDSASETNNFINRLWERINLLKKKRLLKGLIKTSLKKIKILDVGVGDLSFLKTLDDNFEKFGVEKNPLLSFENANNKIKIFKGDFTRINLGKTKYDFVTMWHVIEHIENPRKVLSKVRKVLKKGGFFVFSTPNPESLGAKVFKRYWFHLDAPRHLVFLSQKGVDIIANKAGFRRVKTFSDYFEFPLDLFWSSRKSLFFSFFVLFYPILKILDKETLTYIYEKT